MNASRENDMKSEWMKVSFILLFTSACFAFLFLYLNRIFKNCLAYDRLFILGRVVKTLS